METINNLLLSQFKLDYSKVTDVAIVFPFNFIDQDHVFMTLGRWFCQVNHCVGVASVDEYS